MHCAKFGRNFAQWYSRRLLNFVIVYSLFRYYFPLEKDVAFHLWILNPYHSSMLCAKFINFVNVFSLFYNYLHMEKRVAIHLNKLESPWSKHALCQVWLKLVRLFLRIFYFNFVDVFSLFRNYIPLERAWPFKWTNLNPFDPSMLCAKFGRNWPDGSGEDFWISSMYFP